MGTYADISNGVVTNLFVADSQETADQIARGVAIEYTDKNPVGIGDEFKETPKKTVK